MLASEVIAPEGLLRPNIVSSFAVLAAIALVGTPVSALTLDRAQRKSDLAFLVDQIAAHYAYLQDRHIDLPKLQAIYERKAEAADAPDAFLHVIEEAVSELHDHHATLGVNNDDSPQLIPTGTEIWAQMRNGRAILTEVRRRGDAARVGLRAGDEVLAIDGVPVAEALTRAGPKALAEADPEADNFTLRTLLAGTHEGYRLFTVRGRDGVVREARLAPYKPPHAKQLVVWRWVKPKIGYIRIENSLGESDTVKAFDAALEDLKGADGLILDLRNTPSGGSSDVGEPILGRFITKASAYQRVFDPGPGKVYPNNSWLKTATPRGTCVKAKLVVLVDHWTSSMGEGITIGFDALQRAKIVGTEMAGLSGGTAEFTLPNSKISIHLPTEQLYQVNGARREIFTPAYLVDLAGSQGDDPIFERGVEVLERDLSGNSESFGH